MGQNNFSRMIWKKVFGGLVYGDLIYGGFWIEKKIFDFGEVIASGRGEVFLKLASRSIALSLPDKLPYFNIWCAYNGRNINSRYLSN